MSPPRVRLTGVGRSFGGRAVLAGVDLALSAGRIAVLVGPSGSGKSVLLDLILGLERPDAGRVEVRGPVGMVFQDSALFDDMSVAANLAFPARRLPAAERAARVSRAAEAVALAPGHLAVRPSQLSGGLRKRAAIGRALVQAPPVLLYDEPTAGLDSATGARIGEAILAARAALEGQTVLVVTHDYALAATVADEIHYLDPATHRIAALYTADALAGSDRAARVPDLRRALEAHFAAQDPPPTSPGTERPPPWRRLATWVASAAGVLNALTGVRPPPPAALARRFWEMGVTSVPSVLVSGVVLGLITALQVGEALGHAFGDLDPLPAMIGVVLCHHVGPLYTGLFLAGRVGAGVASEVGMKTYLRQADALVTFETGPEAVWLSPMLIAAVVSFPAMAMLLEASGVAGGFITYVAYFHENTAGFRHTVLSQVRAAPFLWGLARAAVSGLTVVTLAYHAGRGARRGSDAVGRATTRAVVAGLLGAIAVELVFGLFTAGSVR